MIQDDGEPPPNYDDIFKNVTSNDALYPSAPLLNDSASIVHIPDNLKFSLSNTSQDSYGFFIRDQMELLVAKGTVLDPIGNLITLNSPNGKTFLELFAEENKSRKCTNLIFKVNHFNVLLGNITINGNKLDSIEVTTNLGESIYPIIIEKFEESADIIVTIDNVTACRIYIKTKNVSKLSFDASVSFSNCNRIDKYFLMSVTIAYMVSRNKSRQVRNFSSSGTRGTAENYISSNSRSAVDTYSNSEVECRNQTEIRDTSVANECCNCLTDIFKSVLFIVFGVILVITISILAIIGVMCCIYVEGCYFAIGFVVTVIVIFVIGLVKCINRMKQSNY